MLLFISQRVNTLPPFIRNQNGLFQLINRLEWVFSRLAKSIEHGSIFFGYNDIQWERWYQIGCRIGGFYFPQAFPCTASTGRRGRVQTQLKGCTTEALLRPARKRKILEPQNPLVELKTSSNGKTRPFAVGDSQCAGEGARGDGELLCFFQFCFLKLLFHAHMGNLQENLHNTMHKPVEGEEELTSPCSVLSITSSKESVARWSFTFFILMLPVLPFFVFFAMSSEALDSTPRLEVNLDQEGLAHTRALGLALALLSGVLMTVYSRCPTTRMAIFMFSELWTCHL